MTLSDVGEWQLAAHIGGDGPAVVLLHGLLTDSRIWGQLPDSLAPRHRVISVDAPGHGGSPARPAPFTLEAEADALADLVRGLTDGAPAVWTGHSMGGMKAMRVALAHPDLVHSLVLVSTQPHPEPERTARPYEAMVEMAKTWGMSEDMAEVMGRLNFGKEYRATPEGRAWIRHLADIDGYAVEHACEAVFRRGDISDRLEELRVPTLVVHGSDDIPIRVPIARAYADRIPGARFVQLEATGHTPPCERPAQLRKHIEEFLATLPAHPMWRMK
ncbi:MAG: alpha/beta fold hydrolase [Streptomyces sp.]|nr:alpha/beta fold hydrolase [Streptomyces sp.]